MSKTGLEKKNKTITNQRQNRKKKKPKPAWLYKTLTCAIQVNPASQ